MRTSFEACQSKLVAWVDQQARLGLPEGNTTVRKNLEFSRKQYAKRGETEQQLNERFPQLVEIEVEPELIHLKYVFGELSAARGEGMNGPLALTYGEILSYCTLMDTTLTPREVQTIKRMDNAYLCVVSEHLSTLRKAT